MSTTFVKGYKIQILHEEELKTDLNNGIHEGMRLRLVADDADPVCAAAWARPRVRRHQVPTLTVQQQSTADPESNEQIEWYPP
jgi:hypothetical protein